MLFLSAGLSGQYCVIDKDCSGWSTLWSTLNTDVKTDMTGVVSIITDLALALTDVSSVTLHNNYCGGI